MRILQSLCVATVLLGLLPASIAAAQPDRIGQLRNVSLEEFNFNPTTLKGSFLAKLGKGTLSVISGDIARGSPEAMRIRTPSAILGVRGTRFLVRVDEK